MIADDMKSMVPLTISTPPTIVTYQYHHTHSGDTIYCQVGCGGKPLTFNTAMMEMFQQLTRKTNNRTLVVTLFSVGKQHTTLCYYSTGIFTLSGPQILRARGMQHMEHILSYFHPKNTTFQMSTVNSKSSVNGAPPTSTPAIVPARALAAIASLAP